MVHLCLVGLVLVLFVVPIPLPYYHTIPYYVLYFFAAFVIMYILLYVGSLCWFGLGSSSLYDNISFLCGIRSFFFFFIIHFIWFFTLSAYSIKTTPPYIYNITPYTNAPPTYIYSQKQQPPIYMLSAHI